LSGKWRRGGAPVTSSRAERVPGRYDLDEPANQRKLDAAEALAVLAEEAGMSLVHLALAWVLHNPAVTSAIIGPRTMQQLTTQLDAADLDLDDALLDRIDEIVPPGTNFSWADAGYSPPMVANPSARRGRG
jgi:aryl-alcohol dehydrogenase-like predicted oxidoreductase